MGHRLVSFLVMALSAVSAQAETPLSAIDWLSNSVTTPAAQPVRPAEDPALGSGAREVITVTPLDEVSSDAVGLLPVSVTGLPRDLWGTSSSATLAALLGQLDTDLLPALQSLLYTLLLAELDPPADSDPTSRLFLARIDALLALGAVEQAQALLNRAGPDDPERFRRWFDASLLTGTEDAACERLRRSPQMDPTLPTRIFCLARGGDWNAAALTLETGRALGEMTAAEDAVLTRFLDDVAFEDAPPLPPPSRPSPLMFRLYETIGEALPTTTLPLPFAHADLRPISGWKAQLEAAERLARAGALPVNRLLALYTERLPAASGGVWTRVAAVQKFDMALQSEDPTAVGSALAEAWRALSGIGLEAAFAEMFGPRLMDTALAPEPSALAFRINLLTEGYETAAQKRAPEDATERFLKGIARGDLSGIPALDGRAEAIADGFRATGVSPRLARLVEGGDLGEAILRAIVLGHDGARGDLG